MQERVESIIQKLVSEFINRESNRTSMITVTRVEYDKSTKRTNVFLSTFPEKDTRAAVEFLNRRREDLRLYFKKHSKLASLPRITFLPDPVVGGTIEEVIEPE